MNAARRAPEEVVADLAERLAAYVERYEAAHDTRAVFAYLYLELTRTLATSLAVGEPRFGDPRWVAGLAERLAAEYFTATDAMDAWRDETRGVVPLTSADDIPSDVPEPWREVFWAISEGRSYVLEDALFSMMAHISYDLPLALRRMSRRTDVAAHLADFHGMNDVLGAAVDVVQGELADRYCWWLASLDHLLARDDELLSNYGVRVARGMAWYNFQRLLDADTVADAERSIRTSTGSFIRQVREPGNWVLSAGLRTARTFVPERRRWPPAGSRP